MNCSICGKYVRSNQWAVPDRPSGFTHKTCMDRNGYEYNYAQRRVSDTLYRMYVDTITTVRSGHRDHRDFLRRRQAE